MAEILPRPGARTSAAAALIRAMLADDRDTGMLIIDQNGGHGAGEAGQDLTVLLIDTVALAQLILLKACGYDVAKALHTIEGWMEQLAARENR